MICERNTVIGIKKNNFTINDRNTYTEEAGFPMADKCVKGQLVNAEISKLYF